MYKVVNGTFPETMNEVFKQRNNSHYNLRHTSQFSVNPVHSVYNGTESALQLGPQIWEQIPSEIRKRDFKREIKKWKPTDCPCRIRKIFMPKAVYVNIKGLYKIY